MKLIEKLKNDHMYARKEGDKAKLDTLTMLLSRADRDRLKYELKDVVEMTDEQGANKAIEMFNEQDHMGRRLIVSEAKPMKPREQRSY